MQGALQVRRVQCARGGFLSQKAPLALSRKTTFGYRKERLLHGVTASNLDVPPEGVQGAIGKPPPASAEAESLLTNSIANSESH